MRSDPIGNFCDPSLPLSSFVLLFLLLCPLPNVTRARSNIEANHVEESRSPDYYEPDIEPYESHLVSSHTTSADAELEEASTPAPAPASAGKAILAFRKNGVRVDVRMIPAENESLRSNESLNADDKFPKLPLKDIGGCIFKLSLTCLGKRLTLFLEAVGHLEEITILGEAVKLVRTRPVPVRTVTDRRMVDASLTEAIDRAIENFFETFSLRITLPRLNGREERSRIDVELDEPAEPTEHQERRSHLLEGRGKIGGGGGGGGKGNKGGGGGGGGKCKRMMMFMLMMIKMKMMGVIGLTAMKGMMMAGMSLMISKFMLIQKLMALKKGGGGGGGGGGAPWQSAGGGGGGAPLKEIILVTKASGGAGGGGGGGGGGAGCCGGGPSDSYGAPPANSYGPPSGGGDGYDYGGGGGGGGGGGWGRSFDNGALGASNEEPMIPRRNTSNGNSEYSPLAFRYYENYRNTKRNSDTSKSSGVNASVPLQSSTSLSLQRISNFRDEKVFNT